jgi:hypothetical protein
MPNFLKVVIPFQGLDKGMVMQEKRIFNDTPLNPKKCCQLITKILYIIAQGELFTKTEATDLFFAVTRLFQSKDVRCSVLRSADLQDPFEENGVLSIEGTHDNVRQRDHRNEQFD